MFEPFAIFLTYLYTLTGNLGLAIILFTILLRLILMPLSLSSLRSAKKMKDVQPELEKLKKKYGKDSKGLQKAQMEFYKSSGVNPLAGCLPQIIQLIVLIFLYQAFIYYLKQPSVAGVTIDPYFIGIDLSQPDPTYVLPALTVITQLIFSLMMVPGPTSQDMTTKKSKSKALKKNGNTEFNTSSVMNNMQKQMLFIMPIMTGFFAIKFPAGLALYWIVTTIINIFQQWYVSGPGGLKTYSERALLLLGVKKK